MRHLTIFCPFDPVGADQSVVGAERPVLQLRAMWPCGHPDVQVLPRGVLLVTLSRPFNPNPNSSPCLPHSYSTPAPASSADHRSLDWDGIHEKICGAVSVIRGPAAGKVGSDEERAARENELHDFRVSRHLAWATAACVWRCWGRVVRAAHGGVAWIARRWP